MPFAKVILLGMVGEQSGEGSRWTWRGLWKIAHIHCCMPRAWHSAWHIADASYVCVELVESDSVLERMVRIVQHRGHAIDLHIMQSCDPSPSWSCFF